LQRNHFVTVVVGLSFEARIAAGPGVRILRRGQEGALAEKLDHGAIGHCLGVISFGIAAGIASHLRPGSVVIASAVADSAMRHATDPVWSKMLLDAIPGASHALVAGVDAPVATASDKRLIHRETGAASVDMESHLAARLAADHGLPFAVLRVVADPAHRDLPDAALAGMRPDGTTDVTGVLRALAGSPSQVSPLMRVAIDVAVARSALVRSRQLLGQRFGAVLGQPRRRASEAPVAIGEGLEPIGAAAPAQ
jgi:adenosylhomocysteine nucleosidase